jgi:hypothetical protein
MKFPLLILLLLLFAACETDVNNPDWPDHDPKLVITASVRLTADSAFVFCRVSRTMGLGEDFRMDRAMVNDAEVNILNDGKARAIPYRQNYYPFTSDANYLAVFPRGTFTEYTLTVRWGDLYARAALSIPDLPLAMDTVIVRNTQFGTWGERELHYVLRTPLNRVRYDMALEEQVSGGVWLEVPWGPWSFLDAAWTNPTAGSFRYGSYINSVRGRYTITARSPEYNNYENSRWSSDHSGSPFEPDAKNPPFNITGDGIGFFWYELVGEAVEIPY